MGEKLISPWALLVLANKAFGFTPDYTLWEIDAQTLNAMLSEYNIMNRQSKVEKDEKGEFEWIEIPNIDGGVTKGKRYLDPTIGMEKWG
jgi:hypothetical protein